MMVSISNIHSYNEKMRKTFVDKTFFLGKIDATSYLDYGCADGSMIEFMANLFPEYKYYGVDTDENMIRLAKTKNIKNAYFTTDNEEALKLMNHLGGKTALILSSVVHEIYSYCSNIEYEYFFRQVANADFDYIIVRDMCVDDKLQDIAAPDDDISSIFRKDFDQVASFEKIWGEVENLHQLVHYLLKYTYTDNWEREVRENYLGVTTGMWLKIKKNYFPKYNILQYERFKIPYIVKAVEKDFGINLTQDTHMKLILELKK